MDEVGREEKREKCFVIMPISDQGDYPPEHFKKVYEQIFKPAIIDAGYEPFRVDEDRISTPIIGKIFEEIQACPIAICDLSNKNPNVLYELGLRQAYDKPVVLVKDEKTQNIFDVSGINTIMYSSDRLYEHVMADRKNISDAIKATMTGKSETIIKIVKAEKAQFSSDKLSEEDSIRIMLTSIMNEISALKQTQKAAYYLDNNDRQNNYRVNEYRATRIVKLKKGLTNKQMEVQLERIRDVGALKSYRREGNQLLVELETNVKEDIIWSDEILLGISDDYNLKNYTKNR